MDDQQYSRPFRGNRVIESESDDDMEAVKKEHARAPKLARRYSESSSDSSRHSSIPPVTPSVAPPVGDAAGVSARVTRSSTRRSAEQPPVQNSYAATSSTPISGATQVRASAAFPTPQPSATHQQSPTAVKRKAQASLLQCLRCDATFPDRESLQTHKKDEHMTCREPNCKGKVKVFKRANHYRHHMRRAHGIKVEIHPRFRTAAHVHRARQKRRKSVQQEDEESDTQTHAGQQDSFISDDDSVDLEDRSLQEQGLLAVDSNQDLRHDTEDPPTEQQATPDASPLNQQHDFGSFEANTIHSLKQTIKRQQDKLDKVAAAMREQKAQADQQLQQQSDAHQAEVAELTRFHMEELNRLRGGMWAWNYLGEQADERIGELEAMYQREIRVERDRHKREERRLWDLLGRNEESLP